MSETRGSGSKYSPVRNKRAGSANTREALEDLVAVPSGADAPLEVTITEVNGVLGRIRALLARVKQLYVKRLEGGTTDNSVPRWDGSSGTSLQDSSVTIDDGGRILSKQGTGSGTVAEAVADDFVIDSSDVSSVGMSILSTDDIHSRVYFGSPTDKVGAFLDWVYDDRATLGFTLGAAAAGAIVRILSGNAGLAITIDSSQNVGVGTDAPACPLHVDQSSATGAVPVLTLDQGDDSEEMIEFIGTIGTGNALEAIGGKTLTTTHFIKVTLPGGLTRYIPCGTIA